MILFLGYLKNSNEVITSMYHGTLFSIKYEKKFAVIIDPYRINKFSILEMLGLDKRIYNENRRLDDMMSDEINYCHIGDMLKEEKQKATAFILDSIKM